MGVNLVPEIQNDSIVVDEEDFILRNNGGEGSIESGCITEGHHRVLRFTVVTYNRGNTKLAIGAPTNRPDIFATREELGIPQAPSLYYMREKFYLYSLTNNSDVNLSGFKRPFCLADFGEFDCHNQGIGIGASDMYESDLPCQFIIVDGLADGEYVLQALTNAPSVLAVKRHIGHILFEEDNYDDNCVAVRLKIHGNNPPEILGPGTCTAISKWKV